MGGDTGAWVANPPILGLQPMQGGAADNYMMAIQFSSSISAGAKQHQLWPGSSSAKGNRAKRSGRVEQTERSGGKTVAMSATRAGALAATAATTTGRWQH